MFVDPAEYAAYRELLLPLAERYGVDLPAQPVEDDDGWQDKVDVLVEAAPPVVSFTFGLPDPAGAAALRRAGCALVQTVTSPEEARLAAEAGMDGLAVQSADAGGHWGTFTPERVPARRAAAPTWSRAVAADDRPPVLAAGGVGTADDVQRRSTREPRPSASGRCSSSPPRPAPTRPTARGWWPPTVGRR